MAARSRIRRDRATQAELAELRRQDPQRFSPVPPPDPDVCRECCRWGLANESAPELGYVWVQHCRFECGHAHHEDEVWLAIPN